MVRMLKALKKPSGPSRVLHSAASHFHRRWLKSASVQEFWKAYRYIRFTNTGLIDESIGQWSEKTRSFVYTLVNASQGITRTSTSRIGSDALYHHVLAKGKDGKVHMDVTIKLTRRK